MSTSETPLILPKRLVRWEKHFRVAGADWGIDPLLLAAICDRESGGGAFLTPNNPSGVGDKGHGRGLMQIDDRYWTKWIAQNYWQDALTNILKGAEILKGEIDRFTQTGHPLNCAVAAYNCGPARVRDALARGEPCDLFTTQQNYSEDVFRRMRGFEALQQGVK